MTSPAELGLAAAREGKAAALAGNSPHACPYAATRPFTRRAWLLGYVAGRKEAGTQPDPGVDVDVAPAP